jgi:hypothetical protein
MNVSSQLTEPKGTNIMRRFAKCFEVTKGFSCFKMLETMTTCFFSGTPLRELLT